MTPSSPGSPERRTVAVVLAAGLGTRMKSATPKVLHPVCGRPMIEYVLDAASGATGTRPVVVYSPATEAVRDAVAPRADATLQDEPRGTGDALAAALAVLPDGVEEILVVSGDVPLVQADLLSSLLELRGLDHAAIALVSVDAIDPTGLGRVVRNDGGTVERIVEDKDATDEERQISEINAGLYAIDAAWLRRRIGDLRPSPTTGELYLTDLVAFAREDGRIVAALDTDDDGRLTGINDRSQLARAEWDMRVDLNDRWMRAGVTMLDPSTVYLDHSVDLAQDVVLEPNVTLRGATIVGERTRIASGSQVFDSRIGARLRDLGERRRAVDRGGRGHDRPVQPPAAGLARGPPFGDRQLRRAQEQPPRRARPPAPQQLPGRRRRRRRHQRRARARSRPTTTACTSTARRSGRASSSASTRCSGRR